MSARLTAHLKNGVRTLSQLEDVSQLSPIVWRILAQNPGAYTLQGTCTYLVGSGKKRLLIDTGDAFSSEAYLEKLSEALERSGAEGLDGIIITHWHHDHLGGVPGVQSKYGPVPVYKNLPEVEEAKFGDGEMSISAYESWPKEKFTPIFDGDILKTEGASLKAILAPGHANDLCVFVLLEEKSAMFTSDNVLGEGTGVILNLREYLHSLRKMKAEKPSRLYPGHGQIIEDGPALIEEYIAHRMKRVDEVLKVIQESRNGALSVEDIAKQVYGELPQSLFPPAMWNVKMALDVLLAESKCESDENMKWKARI